MKESVKHALITSILSDPWSLGVVVVFRLEGLVVLCVVLWIRTRGRG